MPSKINNEKCKKLADEIERLVSDFSTSHRTVETGILDKVEAYEISRILKESERGFFYECETRAFINPSNLISGYKLIVKIK